MEIRQKQPAGAGRNQPQPYRDFWEEQADLKLLLSSADRGWSGLSAQICNASKGVIPWRTPQSDIRICVDVGGSEALVTRRAPGIESRIVARRGTVWLSPPGLQEGSVGLANDMTAILQIHLPLNQFSPGNFDRNIDEGAIRALRYESAVEDPLLAEIGCAIASELQAETSAGRLLIEALTSSLAARLVQKHITAPSAQSLLSGTSGGLDRRRLFRVLDYIDANLEGDLSIDRMATIACLSRFHFARAFKQAVGHPPHRYVSDRRLERAKALLTRGDRSLADIALTLSFSDQASFTRAFRHATGHAPGQYRRQPGLRPPTATN